MMAKKKVESPKSFDELFARIECDTGLLFVDTPEETRIIRELFRKYKGHSVQFWSLTQGLIEIPKEDDPERFLPHDYSSKKARTDLTGQLTSRGNIMNTFTIIEEDCRKKIANNEEGDVKTIYVLRDADKFFQQPGPLRACRDLIYLASCASSSIIVTGFGIQIPTDLEKDSAFVRIPYPTAEEINGSIIPNIQKRIERHNRIRPEKDRVASGFNPIEVSRACAGLTEDQILNTIGYSTSVKREVNTDLILEEKRGVINKSDILEYWVCDTTLNDVGGFKELKEWFKVRKVIMNHPEEAKKFGAKPPKGIMLLGVQGSGKAMPLYTKVLMEDKTFKELGSIEVGDVVRTPNGKTAKIINIFEHKNKNNFRITFADGRAAECCDEHLWKIYNKNFKSQSNPDGWKVVETKEITRLLEQKDDTRRFYIPLLIDSQDAIELPIDSYVLGVLLGDGSFRYNVQFSSNDQEIVDKVSSRLTSGYHIHSYNTHSVREHRIARNENDGHSTNIYKQELIKMGLWGLISKEKFIPEYYFTAPLYQKISLLQGLIDTDGSTDSSLSISTSSKRLAKDIQRLIWSIGGICTISNRITTCEGKEFPSFRVNIRYRDPKELVHLTRKKDKLSNDYQYSDLKLEIESIEYVGKEDMRCIMLNDEEHLYVTDNYIVTHNTYIAKSVAADLGVGVIKLEMGKVFAGLVGESEKRMRMALAQAAAAGGVVVIDEIDKGLSGAGSSDRTDGGTTSRVIGTLLTWMSEDHPNVFIIATANDISALNRNHPELLRKGRFDEIWFSDCPTPEEREEIFAIHLRRNGRDPSKFDLKALAEVEYNDEGGKNYTYTGAEIEYSVQDAIQEKFAQGDGKVLEIGSKNDITTEDVASKLKIIKPITYISRDVIDVMRRWAGKNARRVSGSILKVEKTPVNKGKNINMRTSIDVGEVEI